MGDEWEWECDCSDWKPNIKIINSMILIQTNMSWGNKKGFIGKRFKYCPWCGNLLTVKKKEKE